MPAERLSEERPGSRKTGDFLIKLPSVIFGLLLSWDPKKESASDIYISNLQSLISFDIYLFIYWGGRKKERKKLNQTERHRVKPLNVVQN